MVLRRLLPLLDVKERRSSHTTLLIFFFPFLLFTFFQSDLSRYSITIAKSCVAELPEYSQSQFTYPFTFLLYPILRPNGLHQRRQTSQTIYLPRAFYCTLSKSNQSIPWFTQYTMSLLFQFSPSVELFLNARRLINSLEKVLSLMFLWNVVGP